MDIDGLFIGNGSQKRNNDAWIDLPGRLNFLVFATVVEIRTNDEFLNPVLKRKNLRTKLFVKAGPAGFDDVEMTE